MPLRVDDPEPSSPTKRSWSAAFMPPKKSTGPSKKSKKRDTNTSAKASVDKPLPAPDAEKPEILDEGSEETWSTIEKLPEKVLLRIIYFFPDARAPGVEVVGAQLALQSLSATRAAIRARCMPHLFHTLRFTIAGAQKFEDQGMSRLLAHPSVIKVQLTAGEQDLLPLADLLKKNATTCLNLKQLIIVANSFYPTTTGGLRSVDSFHSVLQAITLCPMLQTVRLEGLKWTLPPDDKVAYTLDQPPNLTHFEIERTLILRHKFAPAWKDENPNTSYNQAELAAVDWVLSAWHTKLEHLSIPGRIAPIEAMSRLAWPALVELKIVGSHPITLAKGSSLKGLIIGAPNLRSLTVCMSYLAPATSRFLVSAEPTTVSAPHLAPTTPSRGKKAISAKNQNAKGNSRDSPYRSPSPAATKELVPAVTIKQPRRSPRLNPKLASTSGAGSGAAESAPSTSSSNVDVPESLSKPVIPPLSNLLHLSVGNPSNDDYLWDMLPSNLVTLSLLGFPHYLAERHIRADSPEGFFSLAPIQAIELLQILKRISLASLTTLRISFWSGEGNGDLLDHIVKSYQQLQVLEIHRNHDAEHTVDLTSICERLAAMQHLRELYLDLFFPDTYSRMARIARMLADDEDLLEDDILEQEPGVIAAYKANAETRANVIMECIPQLLVLGLALDPPAGRFHWLMYRRSGDVDSGDGPHFDENSRNYFVHEF